MSFRTPAKINDLDFIESEGHNRLSALMSFRTAPVAVELENIVMSQSPFGFDVLSDRYELVLKAINEV